MKKLRYTHGVRRCSQEQPAPLETTIFAEQQAQAKSGVITAPTGADATIKALGDSAPVQNTLAGVMRDAFSATPLNKIAIISIAKRNVTIVPAGTNIAAVTAADGIALAATFVKDDATKASSPWTATPTATPTADALAAVVDAVKPSMSVESLANKIEDQFPATNGDDPSGFIVVDQANNTFKVYEGTWQDVDATDAAGLLTEDANFVQTLSTPTAQFGE